MAPPPGRGLTTIKRINKEIQDLAKEDTGGIVLVHTEADLFRWTGWIPGPAGSPYEGGRFEVAIALPVDYPFSAPKMRFKTKVYHCNVNADGNICLDTLKSQWSPALSLFKVMLSLSSLLTDPNPKDPLDPAVAALFRRDRAEHDRVAREWTRLYALPPAGSGTGKRKSAGGDGVESGGGSGSGGGAGSILSRVAGRPAGSRTTSSTSTGSARTKPGPPASNGGRAGEPIVLADDSDSEGGRAGPEHRDTSEDARDAAAADGAVGGHRKRRRAGDSGVGSGTGSGAQPIVLD